MSGSTEARAFPEWQPEAFQAYLRVLAEVQLRGAIRRRIDPSDIVQETLMAAQSAHEKNKADPEHLEMLSSLPRTKAWLRTILAHTISNFCRAHGAALRDLEREESLEVALATSSSRLACLLPSTEPSPSAVAAGTELTFRLVEALIALPPAEHRAIVLHRLGSYTLAQVAADMDRSVNGVAGLIRRGLAKLREEISD